MARYFLIVLVSCAPLLGSAALQPANTLSPPLPLQADGVRCGNERSNKYATYRICVNALSYSDGKSAPTELLDAVPEKHPWLFPFVRGRARPWQMIAVTNNVGGFSTLQIVNGWPPDAATGAAKSQFQEFGRAREVLIETASGHNLRQTLKDSGEAQIIALPDPAAEEWVRLTVLTVYPGRRPIVALRWFSIAWEADQ